MEKEEGIKKKEDINSILSKIENISHKIGHYDTKEVCSEFVTAVREFFSAVFSVKYQLDFSEFRKVIEPREMDKSLKERIYLFLNNLSSFSYSPSISKQRLQILIDEFKCISSNMISTNALFKNNKAYKKESKSFWQFLMEKFLSEKRKEELKREKLIIDHLNRKIDQISRSIEDGDQRVDNDEISSVYSLYNSLPKKKKGSVNSKIKRLFKDIKTIDNPRKKEGAFKNILAKLFPVFKEKPKGIKDKNKSKNNGNNKIVRHVVVRNEAPIQKHYTERAQEYISKMFKKGLSEEDIRKEMIQVGWPEEIVDELINEFIIKNSSR